MILVTGATGFVGRHIVRALRDRGKPVLALVHTPERAQVIGDTGAEIIAGDILEPASLQRIPSEVEAVVHLVGIISERGHQTFQGVMHQGVRNVVGWAKGAGVRRIVHMGALGVREDPKLPYFYAKWQGEQVVAQSGIPYTIFRPSIQFGEGDEFINKLAAVVKAFPLVPIVGSGKALFHPIAVEEVAECFARALDDSAFEDRTVELGGPEHLTYEQIIDIIARTLGVRRVKVHLPVSAMQVPVALMQLLLPRPPATQGQLDMLKVDNITEVDATERAFGFTPRSLEGNIGFIHKMSYKDAWKTALGFIPRHIRDH